MDMEMRLVVIASSVMAVGVIGWISNIVQIIHGDGWFDAMFIARCIGVVVAPLGAVLGYF
jgi:hypothetical protein